MAYSGWNEQEYCYGDNRVLYLDIKTIDSSFEDLIDRFIVKIFFGGGAFSIGHAKNCIKDFLGTAEKRRKIGAVAEFFVHVYLSDIGMRQESLFRNLEESSPKKGFDGVYLDDSEQIWYVESKGGNAPLSSHLHKVEEAYRDITKKLEGKCKNDPWLNAYGHVMNVDANLSLLEKFSKLSEEFVGKYSHKVSEFSIIPCGTVFASSTTTYRAIDIADQVKTYFAKREYEKYIAICITQRAIKEFEEYLNK